MEKSSDALKSKVVLQRQLGNAVRSCRSQMGISQEELAWRSGLHRTYIADIERGSRNISLRNIANLASALEMSISGLLADASAPSKRARVHTGPLGEILMIEDDSNDADLALRAFRKAKFSNPIRVLADGDAAVRFLFGKGRKRGRKLPKPALVLLDLNLPKVSGIEILRRMKEEPRTKGIPVVVLTGSQHHKDMAECIRLGAESYIVKPVGFESFFKVTSQLCFKWALLKPETESGPRRQNAA